MLMASSKDTVPWPGPPPATSPQDQALSLQSVPRHGQLFLGSPGVRRASHRVWAGCWAHRGQPWSRAAALVDGGCRTPPGEETRAGSQGGHSCDKRRLTHNRVLR